MRTNDDLRAEYLLLQGQYEDFDKRAISLKGLATPLLGAGIAVGLNEKSWPILAAAILIALSLWLLEAIWKNFQYCNSDRIHEIEAWYRGEGSDELAPFQVFASWNEAWRSHYRWPSSLLRVAGQPFVFLPYAPIVLLSLMSWAWIAGR